MEAGIPFALLFILVLAGLALFGGAMIAAVRLGPARAFVVGLLGCGLTFLALMGFVAVGSHTATYRAPATEIYAQPTPSQHPPHAVVPPALPLGSGMTRILGPDEIPSGGDTILTPSPRLPAEATRPSEGVAAALPTPEWVAAGTVQEGNQRFVVVSGQQFADPTAALNDALNRATGVVRQDFESTFRAFGGWLLHPMEAWNVAGRERYTEEIRRSAGENEFTVYRTHLRVELSPAVRDAIEPIWRQQVSTGRSAITGGLFLMLTAVAGVFAGYFRLDDRTAGRYRWRLRFGSAAAMALAGGTVLAGLTFLPIKSVTMPATPPPIEVPADSPIEVAPPHAPQAPASPDLPQAGASSTEPTMHFGYHSPEQHRCPD